MTIGIKYFGTLKHMSADTGEYCKVIVVTKAYLSKGLSRTVKEDGNMLEPELYEQAQVIYAAV